MKRILFYIVIWLIPTMALADVNHLPKRTIENVADGVIVTYQFDNPIIRPNPLVPGTFFWQYKGFGKNDISSEPSIPFRTDMFVVPSGCDTNIRLLETAYRDTTIVLSPAIPYQCEDETSLIIDSIVPYQGFFPTNILECGPLQNYRNVKLQRVTTTPLQYDYSNHIVRAYSMVKYKITFTQVDNVKEGNRLYNIENNDEFLSNITLNNYHNSGLEQNRSWHTTPFNRSLLILTTNEYLDSIQEFVKWKRMKGNKVYVTTRNSGDWAPEVIKDSISVYYQQYGIQYLLIIGSRYDVSPENASYNNRLAVTDYYYGLPDTLNGIPQVFRGRIPANNPQEVSIILNKIIQYEREPIIDSAFYNTGINCAYFQDDESSYCYEDRAFTLCSEEIRNHLVTNFGKNIYRIYDKKRTVIPYFWNNDLYAYGDTIPTEIRPAFFSWAGKAEDIREKIDAGAFYVFHRDHGELEGWINPCFKDTSIVMLHNGNKLPVVFSINCLTGNYRTRSDCFAEVFLKHQGGGCVAIFAATCNSYSGYSDAMALGMFDAIWPGLQPIYGLREYNSYTPSAYPMYELGNILDQGLIRMGETFGRKDSEIKDYTWKLFHCFGDPSMQIYTETPQYFAEPLIFSRGDSIFVFVEDGDCKITFYDKLTEEVKSYKGNNAAYANPSDSLVICLDRHNYVPYIWDYTKDIYIQNENIQGETRVYTGSTIYVGNHVTTTKPAGDVNIQNSNITIHGERLELHPGTRIDKNFNFKNR